VRCILELIDYEYGTFTPLNQDDTKEVKGSYEREGDRIRITLYIRNKKSFLDEIKQILGFEFDYNYNSKFFEYNIGKPPKEYEVLGLPF